VDRVDNFAVLSLGHSELKMIGDFQVIWISGIKSTGNLAASFEDIFDPDLRLPNCFAFLFVMPELDGPSRANGSIWLRDRFSPDRGDVDGNTGIALC